MAQEVCDMGSTFMNVCSRCMEGDSAKIVNLATKACEFMKESKTISQLRHLHEALNSGNKHRFLEAFEKHFKEVANPFNSESYSTIKEIPSKIATAVDCGDVIPECVKQDGMKAIKLLANEHAVAVCALQFLVLAGLMAVSAWAASEVSDGEKEIMVIKNQFRRVAEDVSNIEARLLTIIAHPEGMSDVSIADIRNRIYRCMNELSDIRELITLAKRRAVRGGIVTSLVTAVGFTAFYFGWDELLQSVCFLSNTTVATMGTATALVGVSSVYVGFLTKQFIKLVMEINNIEKELKHISNKLEGMQDKLKTFHSRNL